MRTTRAEIVNFIEESNRIEGIVRSATEAEIEEFTRFYLLKTVTVEELEHFVSVYEPGARLRDQMGMDVRVGDYFPQFGCPEMREMLVTLITVCPSLSPWRVHILYERLHPFTDCNGRSGRMLWAWQHQDLSRGFLHAFYYQTLRNVC